MPPEWRNFKAPLITGVRGGHTIDLRQMAREGVTLLGSLLHVSDGRLRVAGDLNANLKVGDDTFVQFVRTLMISSKLRELMRRLKRVSTHICAKCRMHCLRSIHSTCGCEDHDRDLGDRIPLRFRLDRLSCVR